MWQFNFSLVVLILEIFVVISNRNKLRDHEICKSDERPSTQNKDQTKVSATNQDQDGTK
jgi:hypothetical protein